jgi:hypothetical protein
VDRQLWQSLDGSRVDPFVARGAVSSRSYSKALQRAVVSFGLDFPYGQCRDQLFEHYALDVPKSSIRNIVNEHCMRIGSKSSAVVRTLPEKGSEEVVVQIDGSMIATIDRPEKLEGKDLRKIKRIEWREFKLCAAREQGSTKTFYDGGFDKPEEAGIKAASCALKAGWSSRTYIHGVGDGARWIKKQFDSQFANRGRYLLDFFHLSEYLAEAAKAAGKEKSWLKLQQLRLKNEAVDEVIEELTALLPGLSEEHRLVVESAILYMKNRIDQLHYADALAKGLPIGSGIIESAHRHLLQRRLKVPGAWILENAQNLAASRILRVNEGLDAYWSTCPEEKAA